MTDIIEGLILEMLSGGPARNWCDRDYLGGLSDAGVSSHEPHVLAALTRLVCKRCKDEPIVWSDDHGSRMATVGRFRLWADDDDDSKGTFVARLESRDGTELAVKDSIASVAEAKAWAERAAVALIGVNGDE